MAKAPSWLESIQKMNLFLRSLVHGRSGVDFVVHTLYFPFGQFLAAGRRRTLRDTPPLRSKFGAAGHRLLS